MSTVVIIGAGDLGGASAQALASRDRVERVLFVDESRNAAAGKALDIQQSGAIGGLHARVDATDDYTRVAAAGVCIIADRFGSPGAEWRADEGLAMLGRLLPYLPDAPLIFPGIDQADLMLRVAREMHVSRRRLVGSAPEAFASALRAIAALEARCSPSEISLAVLGVPGAFVVPWSEAAIGGYALDRVLSQVQISRLEARAASLWPPGPYTLGAAAARAAEAVAGSSARRRLNALTILGGEFGARNRIGALPVLLNQQGIADVRVPSLNTRERVQVETALGL